MGVFKTMRTALGKLIKGVDVFTIPIMLRYENEECLSSKTGGFFSFILFGVIFAITFTSWLTVFNRSKIMIEVVEERETNPSGVEFNKQEFLFMIKLNGYNLSDSSQFFDISVTQKQMLQTKSSKSTAIKMTMCKKQDLAPYGQEVMKSYDTLELSAGLCPESDNNLKITGKWSSPIFQYIKIQARRCDQKQSHCLPDSQFAKIDVFYLNYLFVNRILNPVQSDPINFYIHDQVYHKITPLMALHTNMYLKQYNIETDESIMPYKDLNISKGFSVEISNAENFYTPRLDNAASEFYFRKSSAKQSYQRNYMKIDDLLSYLGGLFGILAFGFGLIVNDYNLYCFQFEMCHKVFKQDYQDCQSSQDSSKDQQVTNQQTSHETGFNFFIYIQYLLYTLLTKLNPDFKWKSMKILDIKIQQTRNQMNIDHLLQKITYYERSFQSLLDEDQLLLLYLQQKISIKELQKQRDLINMEQKHKQQMEDLTTNSNLIFKSHAIANSNTINTKSRRQLAFNQLDMKKSMRFIRQALQEDLVLKSNRNEEMQKIISNSISELQKRAMNGDIVSQRILQGLRPELLKKRNTLPKCKKQNKVILSSLKHNHASKFPIRKNSKSAQFILQAKDDSSLN